MNGKLRLLPLWLGLGFVGCAILLYACLMPSPPQPDISNFDKVEHLLAYAVLGAWFGAVLPRYSVRVFVALAIYGVVIELLQSMTNYRSGDVLDLVADMAGILIGLLLARAGITRWLETIDRHAFPKRN